MSTINLSTKKHRLDSSISKSLTEHREYLADICRLKLWCVWHWQSTHPNDHISDTLRKRVDIYRKTDINNEDMNPKQCSWQDPRWISLVNQISKVWDTYHNNAEAFEAESFAIVWPSVSRRCERDFNESSYVKNYQCGSLTFNPPSKENPNEVFFHIANALSPRSIFDYPRYLPTCLRCVVSNSRQQYQATQLTTASWLNDHPAWQALFPAVWKQRMSPAETETDWHFGFWGQFINARGTFNHKLGEKLRTTGKFPYGFRRSWCTHQELLAHLDALQNS